MKTIINKVNNIDISNKDFENYLAQVKLALISEGKYTSETATRMIEDFMGPIKFNFEVGAQPSFVAHTVAANNYILARRTDKIP